MQQTLFIRITGQVQGVGFRPFVYQLAVRHGLSGWVNNSLEGVHIAVTGPLGDLDGFVQALKEEKPSVAHIGHFHVEERPVERFSSFEIVQSNREGSGQLTLTPDLALCPSCRAELRDPGNRRYRYPFITCNYCGPRYSIMRDLPYDRERTSMEPFAMCPACQAEYDRPDEWRFFSQTNSCGTCGMSLALYGPDHQLLSSDYEECVAAVIAAIREGKTVAVKGVGGYLLCCDACNPDAVALLRKRKNRARKPFAIMYPDVHTAALDVEIGDERAKALEGAASPIVLAPLLANRRFPLCLDLLAPGLDQLGVMIPYAPLFELLLAGFAGPIVATSANRSNSPIVFRDGRALYELSKMADLILVHDREILMPQDDSVLRISKYYRQPVLLRRSRGLAPAFMYPAFEGMPETVMAMGADMKSAFGFLHRTFPYISQYFGDLDSYDTQERFLRSRDHFLGLFEARPEVVLVDKHPQYFSTQLGEELAASLQVPLVEVQHHIAHFAAVLAENRLLDSREPVLGVIWDGTGMGDDGQIWGGEFFWYDKGRFSRCGQLSYFDLILGDKMAREPRISALSATKGIPGADEVLQPLFQPSEWSIYQKMLEKPGNLHTSSMGRLFDAVTALLGLLPVAEYEGEAPLYLEQKARAWFEKAGLDFSDMYQIGEIKEGIIPVSVLLTGIIEDIRSGEDSGAIAAKFHNTLAGIVQGMDARRIAFSGGVFQNELLTDILIHRLGKTRQLYFHRQLSPNDECISFGQMAWHYLQEVMLPSKKFADEVLK